MIFFILYSRRSQELRDFRTFHDDEEEVAQGRRLEAELAARPDDDMEALLLHAVNESAVRASHARYFENATSLLRDLRTNSSAA